MIQREGERLPGAGVEDRGGRSGTRLTPRSLPTKTVSCERGRPKPFLMREVPLSLCLHAYVSGAQLLLSELGTCR